MLVKTFVACGFDASPDPIISKGQQREVWVNIETGQEVHRGKQS